VFFLLLSAARLRPNSTGHFIDQTSPVKSQWGEVNLRNIISHQFWRKIDQFGLTSGPNGPEQVAPKSS